MIIKAKELLNVVYFFQEVLVSKVNKKIRREVSEWDTKNNIFQHLQIELIQKFRDEFELMEDQLAIVEGDMMGRGSRPVSYTRLEYH